MQSERAPLTQSEYGPSSQQQQPQQDVYSNNNVQTAAVVTAPSRTLPCGYTFAQTTPQFGISGKPRARPHFGPFHQAEGNLRNPKLCCCTWAPGPNIPDHWWNGTVGYVTYYFSDASPHDTENNRAGIHACEFNNGAGQPCGHRVEAKGCCEGNCCWCPGSPIPAMAKHLREAHGVSAPPKRQWATDLFDTDGCLDTCFCAPCNGSRQMNALTGYADTFSWGWCLFFTFLGCRTARSNDGKTVIYWIPPHWYIALLTRYSVVQLENIDESKCASLCKICWCSPCSIAQTYRQLSVAGVWPGAYCAEEPPAIAVHPVPAANMA